MSTGFAKWISQTRILFYPARVELHELTEKYELTEDHLKALQSVGQFIGEVLRQLDEEKCMHALSPSPISHYS